MSSLSQTRIGRVAIIGRPNVGKSTLFNVLTRTRKAVVRNEPGVTRDVQIEQTEWWGSQFEVMDTGGITDDKEGFSPLIREQVLSVLANVDLVLCVMDGRAGLVPEDRDIIRIAKESGKEFLLVVNKVDRQTDYELASAEFYEFGMDVIPTSFEKRDNVDRIVEWIRSRLPQAEQDAREGVRISLVGKPNVGKSSLANRLLGERRMLVSDIAGTTVDAIEAQIEYNGNKYILVDTAGLRRSAKRQDGVEFLSAVMSHRSMDQSDIVLLLVDGTVGPTDQDAKVLEYALTRHKGVILVANKSDLGQQEIPEYRKWFRSRIAEVFHFFPDIPVEFISAKTGAGLDRLFSRIEDVWEKLNFHITTSKLNDFFFRVIRQAPAPVWGTQNVKFYYLVKTQQRPPSFIAFANYPKGVTPAYRRFLAKRIQEEWGLEGIPIRIFVMQSRRKKARGSRSEEPMPVELDTINEEAVGEGDFDYSVDDQESWGEAIYQFDLGGGGDSIDGQS
ncbi:MAG: ribosome biogenesis GTPase Der [Bdellovibrionaceae bacterium]|nr:ribosome biogenesis GTPase Der [Bdellovibrionales bacterium]MCB9083910.1 ribosome biogenesis GTPase Der [Pseudobdellovibrionaceae bacterium]